MLFRSSLQVRSTLVMLSLVALVPFPSLGGMDEFGFQLDLKRCRGKGLLAALRIFNLWSPGLFANYLAFLSDVFQKIGVPGYPQTFAASINDVPLLLFHLNRPAKAPGGKTVGGSAKQPGSSGSPGASKTKEFCNRWNDREDDHVCGRAHSCGECGSVEHGKHDCPALGGVGRDKRRKNRGRTEGATSVAVRK